jgi:L-alanine-DL-glutamate epimerase-like enolase superfamily enzyme
MASGIGIAAAHQLVASCRKLFRTDHYGVSPTNADDILREPIQETKATVKFRMGPGLGVELDESKLDRYRVQR